METQIHVGGRLSINPQRIIRLKGDINYTTIYYADGKKKTVVATTLKKIQSRLEPFPYFFRISRNTIINLNCIDQIRDNDILLITGDIERASRRRKRDFFGQMLLAAN
ncbi:MAG: LytTR family transcriptional regulator [Cytophagaceae bacterium]|nr:LytTR family transcriptional regulator [Cytophagaceae bacterium]